jgi:hypothetical protein
MFFFLIPEMLNAFKVLENENASQFLVPGKGNAF